MLVAEIIIMKASSTLKFITNTYKNYGSREKFIIIINGKKLKLLLKLIFYIPNIMLITQGYYYNIFFLQNILILELISEKARNFN